MTKGTIKTKYNHAAGKLQTTLGLWVDDVKLKISSTEKSWKNVSSVPEDIEIGVERPGHFILEHHLHKKHTRFQFHSSAEVLDKNVKLTFVHHHGPQVTTLEGELKLDKHQSAIVKHNFHKKGPLVKYEYSHKELIATPQFDFGVGSEEGWGVSLKKTFGKKEYFKAAYTHHNKEAQFELAKSLEDGGGPLKIVASVNVNNVKKVPGLTIEKEWKF